MAFKLYPWKRVRAGVALKLGTPDRLIKAVPDKCYAVLPMTINPGFAQCAAGGPGIPWGP